MGIEELANIIDEADNQLPSFEKMPAKRPALLPKNLRLADIADLPSVVGVVDENGVKIHQDTGSKVRKAVTFRRTPPTVKLEDGGFIQVPWADKDEFKEIKAAAARAKRRTQDENK